MGIPVLVVALILLLSPSGSSQTAIASTGQPVPSVPLSVAQDFPLPDSPPLTDLPIADAVVEEQVPEPIPPPAKSSVSAPVATVAKPLAIPAATTPIETESSSPATVHATSTPTTVAPRETGATRVLSLPAPSPTAIGQMPSEQEAMPGQALTLTIRPGDTLDELFSDNNLSRTDLANILALKEARSALTLLMPGDEISVRHEDKRITYLSRQLNEVQTLHVNRGDDGFTTQITELPVEVRISHASATINSSLFLAAKAAGISDKLTMNLAGIFAWDIDFVLDIRKGDRFSVIYEEIWQNGQHLRDGDILAAMFQNDGDEFKALRYVDPDDNDGYFTPEGVNVKKAFLRAPIKFTPRVTSNFNPNRMHPVHKRRRPHQGVDYGAPTGTPIIAAGDGKVIFRGRKGGYGNTVILQHGSNITTLYAHMSKFNGSARSGSRVKQGQTIGYVGATGTVTARHLHYEYRVNGVHRNPRTVSLPKAKPIPKKFSDDFKLATAPLLNQLNVVSRDTTRVAMAP